MKIIIDVGTTRQGKETEKWIKKIIVPLVMDLTGNAKVTIEKEEGE